MSYIKVFMHMGYISNIVLPSFSLWASWPSSSHKWPWNGSFGSSYQHLLVFLAWPPTLACLLNLFFVFNVKHVIVLVILFLCFVLSSPSPCQCHVIILTLYSFWRVDLFVGLCVGAIIKLPISGFKTQTITCKGVSSHQGLHQRIPTPWHVWPRTPSSKSNHIISFKGSRTINPTNVGPKASSSGKRHHGLLQPP